MYKACIFELYDLTLKGQVFVGFYPILLIQAVIIDHTELDGNDCPVRLMLAYHIYFLLSIRAKIHNINTS